MKLRPVAFITLAITLTTRAESTINSTNRFAYAANLGWMDWRADGANGARIGEFICSGYLYAANAGWINWGSGAPANGVRYQNNSAADFGVNRDELGNLRGLAWGANLGWMIFTNRDATGGAFEGPKVDLRTGRLTGLVYSANAGWISLSNSMAFLQSDSIAPGADTDGDGLPDAWELSNSANLTEMNATSDTDGDGATDVEEYLSDTDPRDPGDQFRITSFIVAVNGTNATVTWLSRPTRYYSIQTRPDLNPGSSWTDTGLGPVPPDSGATTTRALTSVPTPQRFLRVEAQRPLAP